MTELWLGPDVNADLVALLAPTEWPTAKSRTAVVQGYIQQLYADGPNENEVGFNYYSRLAQYGYYRDLGVPHGAEGPGLKEWDVDPDGVHRGTQAAAQLAFCLDRIRAAGGELTYESLDSSLLARVELGLSLEQAADAVHTVMQTAHENGLWKIGLTEAYPATPYTDTIRFMELLQQRGTSPAHLHLDMDTYAFADRKMSDQQISHELRTMQAKCAAWSTPEWKVSFGILINGGRDKTPKAYHDFALNTVRRIQGWMPQRMPDRLILQSFEKNNFPPLTPEAGPYSHVSLVKDVAALSGVQSRN